MQDACRQGRGDPYFEGVTIGDGTLDDTTGFSVIAADTDKFIVVDAIWFDIPDDITKLDLNIGIDDYFNGSRTIATVTLGGTEIQDLRALWTWENPNPITGHFQGIIGLSNVALEPDASNTDAITILGNDAVDANNYTSTGGTDMQVVARARKIVADAFE
jgi:hypothetical protein